MVNDGLGTTKPALRQRAVMATAVAAGVWLLTAVGLWQIWPESAGRWALLAGLVLAYVLAVLWRNLAANRRAGETAVLPTLGLGNTLTLYRGLAAALLAGFLLSPWPGGWLAWLPALLYMTADVADYLDGYAARVTHHATRLGEILDMEYDSLSVLIVTLLAVWYGQLPLWYLPLGLARYLFVFGLWLRARRDLPIYDLPPSAHRRIFAGFQMGFLSAVLWPIVPPAGAAIAGAVFGGATAVSFLRDWLVAVGWLDPHAVRYQYWQQRIAGVATRRLPLFLRSVLAVSLVAVLAAEPLPAWMELFAGWRLPGTAVWSTVSLALLVGAGTAVMLGVMGRVAAFLLVFPLGFDMLASGLTWANGAALACATAVMLLGPGPWALWRPEEPFMARRAGEGAAG